MISNLVLRARGKNYNWMYLCIVELISIPAMSDEPERIFHSAKLLISDCYFGWLSDFLIGLIGSLYLEGQRPVYVQSPICVRVCSIDLRRITLLLMHILIQPPSSYKSSFSYKASDGAETHDPSTHATVTYASAWQMMSYKHLNA